MRRRRWVRVRVPCADPPPASAVDLASPQRAVDAAEVSHAPPTPPVEAVSGAVEADGDRPSTPVPEPALDDSAAQPAVDGWDCELPDLDLPADAPDLPADASPPPVAALQAEDSDDDESLTPLLERARAVLLAARGSPTSPAASSALRSALVAFLEEQPAEPAAPPASAPPASAPEPSRPVRRELERSSFEDEGSLFDLDAGFVAHHTKFSGSSSVRRTVPMSPSTTLHARRVVTTPERCEPSPRAALARSWTDGVRSSVEAVASGGALQEF